MFVATARYQFERPELKGADKGIPEGLRGSGSQGYASRIWGITGTQYIEKADPWPMNPNGEMILSLKMEDKYSLANIDQITKVPGIAWGEWGPGDQAMSLMGLEYLKTRRQSGTQRCRARKRREACRRSASRSWMRRARESWTR